MLIMRLIIELEVGAPPQLVRQMSLLPIGRVAACPGGGCKKPAPKGDDDVYSDDSDLESCDDED